MFKKKLSFLIIIFILVFSIVVYWQFNIIKNTVKYTTQQQAPDEVGESMEITATFEEGEVVSVVDGEGEAVPYTNDIVVNAEKLDDLHGNQQVSFSTEADMPWYKIWVKNTSTHDYLVEIHKNSSVGTKVDSFYAPAGRETTYQGDTGIIAERVYLSVIQGQSYPLSGTITVKIGTDVASLG